MSGSLHIVRPNLQTTFGSLATTPVHVSVSAPALFQLLEFTLRAQQGNRIIGTLVGSRSDDNSQIEVKDAYIVPHNEDNDEVTIEEYHHKVQYQLYRKSNPKDSILGWFSTTSEVDSFTALIHDFYSKGADGTYPHPAIHLTLNQDSTEGSITALPTINTYIASPIGAIGATAQKLGLYKDSSYFFTPIPNSVEFDTQDKSVLNFASRQVFEETDAVDVPTGSTDLKLLAEELNKIELLINSTLQYIEKIQSGEVPSNPEFGKFLLTNLKRNTNIDLKEFEKSFNSHIQDSLMIEYLASSIKTQLALSAKLTTLI